MIVTTESALQELWAMIAEQASGDLDWIHASGRTLPLSVAAAHTILIDAMIKAGL